MEARSSSTRLPPVRRTKRRDWVRIVARVLCVVFALAGLVPVGVGLLVRTKWARGIATRETQALVKTFGVDAKYELELRLWPLSVEASDGGTPFLVAKKATARPRIFGLLAGKVVIDSIEIEQPKARVVLAQGKLQNLKLDIPETPTSDKKTKAPFSVVSMSEAEIDLRVDGSHVTAREIDADVTTDDDGDGGNAFEVAVRIGEARTQTSRKLAFVKGGATARSRSTTIRSAGSTAARASRTSESLSAGSPRMVPPTWIRPPGLTSAATCRRPTTATSSSRSGTSR
jgi:hypothetical protein